MPEILYAGCEGEYALFPNELVQFGEDDQRRGSVQLEDGDQIFRPLAAAPTDFWLHVRLAIPEPTATFNDVPFISIFNGSTLIAAAYNAGVQNDFVTIIFQAADTDSQTFTMVKDQFYNFDIRITGNIATFYMDEVFRFRSSSGSQPTAVQVAFAAPDGDQARTKVQDFIITDGVPTVGMELVSLPPAAVATYNDFTNDYNDINGPGYDNTTTMFTDSLNDRESWIYADSDFELGDKVIYAFVMSTVAQLSIAGSVDDFRPFLRIGGTNYDGDDLGATSVAPDNYCTTFLLNPDTESPWQRSDFRGLEGGIQTV